MTMLQNMAAACALICSINAFADEPAQVLIERIASSQAQLENIQQQINTRSEKQTARLDQQLREIATLRTQAATIQRVADEQALSLEQLKKRVEQWQSQDHYQKQLLTSYIESNHALKQALSNQEGFQVSATQLGDIVADVQTRLSPSWQTQNVVNQSGRLTPFNVLALGPTVIAYHSQDKIAGPLHNPLESDLQINRDVYDEQAVSAIAALYNNKSGAVLFDPTLGNADKLLLQDASLWQHVQKGGPWAIPIILFGVFSFIISLFKAVQLTRLPKIDASLIERLKTVKANNECLKKAIEDKVTGAQKQLVDIALIHPVSQQRDDLLVAYLNDYKHKIERFLGAIATSAAIAPLLGLLGTVSGMISTFMMMNTFGTSDASTVSGGISEALITTELGLIVAIPSLIMSALLSRRAKSYNAKLESNAIKLSKLELA